MKLRLAPGSVRLRLEAEDVESLLARDRVEAEVAFATSQRLVYALELDDDAPAIGLRQSGDSRGEAGDLRLAVVVPATRGRAWLGSDEVGLEARLELGDASTRVLVEKDLGCSH